jgi:hypothetical protein
MGPCSRVVVAVVVIRDDDVAVRRRGVGTAGYAIKAIYE